MADDEQVRRRTAVAVVQPVDLDRRKDPGKSARGQQHRNDTLGRPALQRFFCLLGQVEHAAPLEVEIGRAHQQQAIFRGPRGHFLDHGLIDGASNRVLKMAVVEHGDVAGQELDRPALLDPVRLRIGVELDHAVVRLVGADEGKRRDQRTRADPGHHVEIGSRIRTGQRPPSLEKPRAKGALGPSSGDDQNVVDKRRPVVPVIVVLALEAAQSCLEHAFPLGIEGLVVLLGHPFELFLREVALFHLLLALFLGSLTPVLLLRLGGDGAHRECEGKTEAEQPPDTATSGRRDHGPLLPNRISTVYMPRGGFWSFCVNSGHLVPRRTAGTRRQA